MEADPFKGISYETQKVPMLKRIKKLIRKADIYALPITLRYKSEKKFYTNFGAATSILLIIFMLGFAISYLVDMYSDRNPKV